MKFPIASAVRDAMLLIATLWAWSLEGASRSEGGIAMAIAVVAGAMATLCGYLVHEWGHLAGAWLAGAKVHVARQASEVFLFRFDSDANTQSQFLMMSMGGFVASGLVIALFWAVLPMQAWSGRIAAGLTFLGVLATAILELPVAWRVWHGAPIPTGAAYRSEGIHES